MSWLGLYISEPTELSIKKGNLLLKKNHESYSIPVEDLAYIILDTQYVQLTGTVLSTCVKKGCLIISCDETHMPVGYILGQNTYYKQKETVDLQLGISKARKKRFWQSIVQSKIQNQAYVLSLLQKPHEKLNLLIQKVTSGDTKNIEAQAARIYWSLYTTNFYRDTSGKDRLNTMLNYGYALLRACIAREVCALGFIPSIAFHHCSLQNPFNLVDDLLEPWRPFVDLFVMKYWKKNNKIENITSNDKQYLATIFQTELIFNGETMQLLPAVRRYCSYIRTALINKKTFIFPKFLQ